jgi:hypothetical protein
MNTNLCLVGFTIPRHNTTHPFFLHLWISCIKIAESGAALGCILHQRIRRRNKMIVATISTGGAKRDQMKNRASSLTKAGNRPCAARYAAAQVPNTTIEVM